MRVPPVLAALVISGTLLTSSAGAASALSEESVPGTVVSPDPVSEVVEPPVTADPTDPTDPATIPPTTPAEVVPVPAPSAVVEPEPQPTTTSPAPSPSAEPVTESPSPTPSTVPDEGSAAQDGGVPAGAIVGPAVVTTTSPAPRTTTQRPSVTRSATTAEATAPPVADEVPAGTQLTAAPSGRYVAAGVLCLVAVVLALAIAVVAQPRRPRRTH